MQKRSFGLALAAVGLSAVNAPWADGEVDANPDNATSACGHGGSTFSDTTSNQVKLVTGTWTWTWTWTTIRTVPVQQIIGTASATNADKVFPAVTTNGGNVVVSYCTRGYDSTNPACFVAIPDSLAGKQSIPTPTSVCRDDASRSSANGFHSERRLTPEGPNPYVQFADGSFPGH